MISVPKHRFIALSNESDQSFHIGVEFVGKAVARAWQVNRDDAADPGRIACEHSHAIGEIHRFLDAMGHVNEGLLSFVPQLYDEAVEFFAHFLVKGCKRLVHQHEVQIKGERPRDRDTLTDAPGEAMRIELGEIRQAHLFERPLRKAASLRDRQPAHFETEFDVATGGPPRKQGVLLKHHPAAQSGPPGLAFLNLNAALGGGYKAPQSVEQAALPAARWADQTKGLAAFDVERDVLHRGQSAAWRGVSDLEMLDADTRKASRRRHALQDLARRNIVHCRSIPTRRARMAAEDGRQPPECPDPTDLIVLAPVGRLLPVTTWACSRVAPAGPQGVAITPSVNVDVGKPFGAA